MASRTTLPHTQFRSWCRMEQKFLDRTKGQFAAARDQQLMARLDLESTTVIVHLPSGADVDCFASPEKPFLLRLVETPYEEFTAWRSAEDGQSATLEPRWFVQVVKDPDGKAKEARLPGAKCYVFARTYVALEPLPTTRDPSSPGTA